MHKFLKLAMPCAVLATLVGCAPLPPLSFQPLVTPTAPIAVLPCATCTVESTYGIAVTRPNPCNDYPVTYRVQMPETDKRVRFVDRPELMSTSTLSVSVNNCGR